MNITDLPGEYLNGKKIHLLVPDLSRSQEMHQLIVNFSNLHREFLTWADDNSSEETVFSNMSIASKNFSEDRDEYKFLIINNHTNQLVGCISLFIRHAQIPYFEIGYWLSTQAMGYGFITEACILVRDLAYHHLKSKRLEIRMARRNIRSSKLAERCGFYCEEILKNNRIDGFGCLDDTCIYIYSK